MGGAAERIHHRKVPADLGDYGWLIAWWHRLSFNHGMFFLHSSWKDWNASTHRQS